MVDFYKPRCTVIDDNTYKQFVDDLPPRFRRGYTGRPFDKVPYGGASYAKPRARRIYDRSEWAERAKDKKKYGSSLREVWRRGGLNVLNQQQTNYCWCNGVVGAYQAKRAFQGLPYIKFSAASVAARLKRYQNVGGWGGEAIEGINQGLLCNLDLWPANEIDDRFDTPEARAYGKTHSVLEWDDLKPGSFEELASALLDDDPVPAGHMWWGHLVCHLDLVQLGRDDWATIFANSWGPDWEDEGFGVMHENKARPDEANALRSVAAVLV